jgi:pyruvate dehydrogenase E1 component
MDQLDDILHQDLDPTETQEWVESLSAVIDREGTERAHYLLERLVDSTRRSGGYLPFDPTTEYVTPSRRTWKPRCRATVRWNGASAR